MAKKLNKEQEAILAQINSLSPDGRVPPSGLTKEEYKELTEMAKYYYSVPETDLGREEVINLLPENIKKRYAVQNKKEHSSAAQHEEELVEVANISDSDNFDVEKIKEFDSADEFLNEDVVTAEQDKQKWFADIKRYKAAAKLPPYMIETDKFRRGLYDSAMKPETWDQAKVNSAYAIVSEIYLELSRNFPAEAAELKKQFQEEEKNRSAISAIAGLFALDGLLGLKSDKQKELEQYRAELLALADKLKKYEALLSYLKNLKEPKEITSKEKIQEKLHKMGFAIEEQEQIAKRISRNNELIEKHKNNYNNYSRYRSSQLADLLYIGQRMSELLDKVIQRNQEPKSILDTIRNLFRPKLDKSNSETVKNAAANIKNNLAANREQILHNMVSRLELASVALDPAYDDIALELHRNLHSLTRKGPAYLGQSEEEFVGEHKSLTGQAKGIAVMPRRGLTFELIKNFKGILEANAKDKKHQGAKAHLNRIENTLFFKKPAKWPNITSTTNLAARHLSNDPELLWLLNTFEKKYQIDELSQLFLLDSIGSDGKLKFYDQMQADLDKLKSVWNERRSKLGLFDKLAGSVQRITGIVDNKITEFNKLVNSKDSKIGQDLNDQVDAAVSKIKDIIKNSDSVKKELVQIAIKFNNLEKYLAKNPGIKSINISDKLYNFLSEYINNAIADKSIQDDSFINKLNEAIRIFGGDNKHNLYQAANILKDISKDSDHLKELEIKVLGKLKIKLEAIGLDSKEIFNRIIGDNFKKFYQNDVDIISSSKHFNLVINHLEVARKYLSEEVIDCIENYIREIKSASMARLEGIFIGENLSKEQIKSDTDLIKMSIHAIKFEASPQENDKLAKILNTWINNYDGSFSDYHAIVENFDEEQIKSYLLKRFSYLLENSSAYSKEDKKLFSRYYSLVENDFRKSFGDNLKEKKQISEEFVNMLGDFGDAKLYAIMHNSLIESIHNNSNMKFLGKDISVEYYQKAFEEQISRFSEKEQDAIIASAQKHIKTLFDNKMPHVDPNNMSLYVLFADNDTLKNFKSQCIINEVLNFNTASNSANETLDQLNVFSKEIDKGYAYLARRYGAENINNICHALAKRIKEHKTYYAIGEHALSMAEKLLSLPEMKNQGELFKAVSLLKNNNKKEVLAADISQAMIRLLNNGDFDAVRQLIIAINSKHHDVISKLVSKDVINDLFYGKEEVLIKFILESLKSESKPSFKEQILNGSINKFSHALMETLKGFIFENNKANNLQAAGDLVELIGDEFISKQFNQFKETYNNAIDHYSKLFSLLNEGTKKLANGGTLEYAAELKFENALLLRSYINSKGINNLRKVIEARLQFLTGSSDIDVYLNSSFGQENPNPEAAVLAAFWKILNTKDYNDISEQDKQCLDDYVHYVKLDSAIQRILETPDDNMLADDTYLNNFKNSLYGQNNKFTEKYAEEVFRQIKVEHLEALLAKLKPFFEGFASADLNNRVNSILKVYKYLSGEEAELPVISDSGLKAIVRDLLVSEITSTKFFDPDRLDKLKALYNQVRTGRINASKENDALEMAVSERLSKAIDNLESVLKDELRIVSHTRLMADMQFFKTFAVDGARSLMLFEQDLNSVLLTLAKCYSDPVKLKQVDVKIDHYKDVIETLGSPEQQELMQQLEAAYQAEQEAKASKRPSSEPGPSQQSPSLKVADVYKKVVELYQSTMPDSKFLNNYNNYAKQLKDKMFDSLPGFNITPKDIENLNNKKYLNKPLIDKITRKYTGLLIRPRLTDNEKAEVINLVANIVEDMNALSAAFMNIDVRLFAKDIAPEEAGAKKLTLLEQHFISVNDQIDSLPSKLANSEPIKQIKATLEKHHNRIFSAVEAKEQSIQANISKQQP